MNPWLNLWIHPRQALRYILDTHPRRMILFLSIVNGIVAALATYAYLLNTAPQDTHFQGPYALTIMILLGAAIGVVHLYFGAWLYKITGGWLGGKGSFTDVKCAVGWSFYPFLVVSLLNLFNNLFLSYFWAALALSILYLIFAVWAFVLFIFYLAEAHRFSAWRGLGTIILAFALVFVAFMLILFIIPILQPLFK